MPLDKIWPRQVQAFSRALRSRLLDRKTSFGKDHLRLLVDKITVRGNEVPVRGGDAKLAAAISAGASEHRGTMPRFVPGSLPIVKA